MIPRSRSVLFSITAFLTLAALTGMALPVSAAPIVGASAQASHACADAAPGHARCFAEYTSPAKHAAKTKAAARSTAAVPRPVTPADIQKAYNIPSGQGKNAVVGIVDAYDNPNAEADLGIFRARYGLPPCTTANGCFRKVNQRGSATPLPTGDFGWGLETALDLDAVSSSCPNCSILLVEADSSALADLGLGVNTAVSLGAKVVSNSYGADEDASSPEDSNTYYNHPGVPILVSTGDDGFENVASFPADASTVIAVGGTTLTPSTSAKRGFNEKAWTGGGSGCSAYIKKPAWQKDNHCPGRTISDISADADSDSGLLVEDNYGFNGVVQVGGTSLSSPLMAGILAMTNTSKMNNAAALYTPAAQQYFNDVTSGTNGFCGGDYLCSARKGFDAPTGVGTPNGLRGLSQAAK